MTEPRYEMRSGAGGAFESPRTAADEEELFRYGSRWVPIPGDPDHFHMVPLTYEDLLDPQVGDQMTQDSLHIQLCMHLVQLLKQHFASTPDVAVFTDLKLMFGIPGLPGPSPDIAIVRGVEDRGRRRASFRAHKEPGKIELVVEIVSASSKKKDYEDLPKVYEKAGIAEYLIIEADGDYLEDTYRLLGYRLDENGRYREIETDPSGGLRLETVALRLALDSDRGLILVDLESGERLLTPVEARQVAEEARQEAEARAEREAAARKALEERMARLEAELRQRSDRD